MNPGDLARELARRWPDQTRTHVDAGSPLAEVTCARGALGDLCGALFQEWGYRFGGIYVEEGTTDWLLRYVFYADRPSGWVHVLLGFPLDQRNVPSISTRVHAADWHEREAEDLFGLVFEGHPRLGDFVLHDDAWQEGVEPMRRAFSAQTPVTERRPNVAWRPRRIVQAPGAFIMPVGPVFTGLAESVHFQLETVGEDVIRAYPRLYYKYRGVEKIAEGKTVDEALLLAERFAATTAGAHALAYCHAVERVCGVEVPERARVLRVFAMELERLRHHVGAIAGICESTALAVASSRASALEEDLLRTTGALMAHRYLFGFIVPGGVAMDLPEAACAQALRECEVALRSCEELWARLRVTSSFIDRLEEVGIIGDRDACEHGLVGPISRASGQTSDLRVDQPYEAYEGFAFDVPVEHEGDGYARLRVLLSESRQSVRILAQAIQALTPGPVRRPVPVRAGAALGAVEAPRGAALHWLRLRPDGTVARYRIVPPSFVNWHGFHLAVEDFAFQDFPIILATLNLSVAENDR